jgi:alpha-amylase/alpha-mannosidase (GH57 family)
MPIRFAFGIHLHQPVGNFDHVFADHVRDVYLPFLERVEERAFFPISVHLSGPLLEWLERHDPAYLDRVGRLAAEGKLELLLAGFYEPVLASLPKRDRVEQIGWMREKLSSLFGVDARGLWLTERVWEPDLAADLHDAGVRYALLDDRHFLVSGFSRDQMYAPFWTESGGKRVAIFPIDEKLRYLIPFQPPADTAEYLRRLRADGHRLAVLADDGEKFGGWPGTKEWVYDRGWLTRFFDTIETLVDDGEVQLSTLADALEHVPSNGLAYLSTASYREMEAWSLPSDAAVRLAKLEKELGEERLGGPEGALVRGSHWRNFIVKYPESNRMHKKMLALSALCRERGDPIVARRAIGRAQCNDAYWHGVFGGLYLPHLRDSIWSELAIAEETLRRAEMLSYEVVDIDCDGKDEVWVHGPAFSAIVAPHRGGAIEEYSVFAARTNYASTLTRRREAYHVLAFEEARASERDMTHSAAGASGGRHGDATSSAAPSIHDTEHGIRLGEMPPADVDTRALFVDRILPASLAADVYERVDYEPVRSWARERLACAVTSSPDAVEVRLSGSGGFGKVIRFSAEGSIVVSYDWDPNGFPAGAWFAPELSLSRPLRFQLTPEPAMIWRYRIETVAKSEKGLDRTAQGESVTALWPVSAGQATVSLEIGNR